MVGEGRVEAEEREDEEREEGEEDKGLRARGGRSVEVEVRRGEVGEGRGGQRGRERERGTDGPDAQGQVGERERLEGPLAQVPEALDLAQLGEGLGEGRGSVRGEADRGRHAGAGAL